VRVLATEDTRCLLRVVRAILLLVANLLTVVALNCWIVLRPVTLTLEFLHVIERIIFISLIILLIHVIERFLIVRLLVLYIRIIIVFIFRCTIRIFIYFIIRFSFLLISAKVFVSSNELARGCTPLLGFRLLDYNL